MAKKRPEQPNVARTKAALARHVDSFETANETIALVPTMGALHPGHFALVRAAKRRADRVIVSIFVNPTQFAPHEDFSHYPRTWTADLAALAREGVDLVWAPSVDEMYPHQFATRVAPEGAATVGLEDRFRPHFFGGVATVVAKLFVQCRPDYAVFGQKDYQQLKVVTRLALDLDLQIKVIGAPIIRERDGLALSSRNVYLSSQERAAAPALHRALKAAAAAIRKGSTIKAALAGSRKAIVKVGFKIDYLEARHAETLAPIRSEKHGPIRLLVAARIGKTRLIDNLQV